MKRDFFINWYKLTKVIFVWSTILFSQIAAWWTYPLKQVWVPQIECKGIHWTELPDSCKIDLPIISNANYDNYKKNSTYRAVYSDIWGWSYNDGRDNTAWWSPGIDVATPEWTPIYTIWDGEVIQAREISWYGKSVTIKHTVGKKVYYSSYSHMSKIEVSEWDKVKEWQKIWEVGKTWFTIWRWWYHLDFSISDAKMNTYPYSYYWWCDAWYMSAVNDGVCRDSLFANTIDPIAFLEFQWDETKIKEFEQNLLNAWKKVVKATATTVTKVETNNTTTTAPSVTSVANTNTSTKPVITKTTTRRTLALPTSQQAVKVDTIEDTIDYIVPTESTTEQNTSTVVTTEKKLAWSTEVTPMDLDYKLAKLQQSNTQTTTEVNPEPTKVNVAKRVVNTSPAIWAWSAINYSTSEIPVFIDGNLEIKISWLYKKWGLTWIKNQDTQIKVVINTIWVDGKKTPFDGKLSKPITFKSATSAIFAPYNYTIVENSYMIIHLSPIAAGTDSLWVYYGDKLLGTYKINIK